MICDPPNIIQIIKSRRMRWVGHVARVEGQENAYRVLAGRFEECRPLWRLCVDDIKMVLK
jgi:hypothetical protein